MVTILLLRMHRRHLTYLMRGVLSHIVFRHSLNNTYKSFTGVLPESRNALRACSN